MKNLKQSILVLTMIIGSAAIVSSCGSLSEENDQLRGFALGGIYFIDGYGGMNSLVDILVNEEGLSDNEELIEGYRVYLEFPFDTSQAADSQSYLKDYWEIGDKAALLEQMHVLKNRDHKYKAWDYARSVNIACNGFSAGYLTQPEILIALNELLVLAQVKYESWEAYYVDYNDGLKDWDPESEQVISFGKLTKDILSHEKSIYKILPLK